LIDSFIHSFIHSEDSLTICQETIQKRSTTEKMAIQSINQALNQSINFVYWRLE